MFRTLAFAAPVAALILLAAGGAQAKQLAYTSTLRGDVDTSMTGSKALGSAQITVDTETQRVSLTLDVVGISLDGLFDNLVKGPIGPIHLHIYSSHNHAKADVNLLLPVPYGANYKATASGFDVDMTGYPYATGAKLLQSDVSFEAFIAALDKGDVVLNVHTDAFHDGEISGLVQRAKG